MEKLVEGTNINSEAEVTGYYVDEKQAGHGFVRALPMGLLQPLSLRLRERAPDRSKARTRGASTLGDLDAASVYHGYRRSRDASFTVFDGPPGNTFVLPLSINSAGTITGLS